MIRLIVILGFIIAVIWILKKAFGEIGSIFTIEIVNGVPKIKGELPGRSWLEVKDFLLGLNLPRHSKIVGYPDGKRFRLSFSRGISEAMQQRIRNFLYFGL
jgi:hypothetical protein